MGYRRHVRFSQLRLSLLMFTFYVCFDGADWMGGGHVTTAWKGSGQQQNSTRCLPGDLSGDNMNGSEPWPWQYQYSRVFNRLIVHCKNIASVSTHSHGSSRPYLLIPIRCHSLCITGRCARILAVARTLWCASVSPGHYYPCFRCNWPSLFSEGCSVLH